MLKHAFEATTANFKQEVLQASQPVLVDFGADWCPPCKMIAPIVDQLAEKYAGQMRVASVNVDEQPDIQMAYGVMGLPTLILFQDGKPVKQIVGYKPREAIEAAILPFVQPVKA